MSTDYRSTFDEVQAKSLQDEIRSPPAKIRKGLNSKSCDIFLAEILGLDPKIFLPIQHAATKAVAVAGKRLKQLETTQNQVAVEGISDDVLGICCFSGYLNSFEAARLCQVSKRFRSIARKQVERLDMRNCRHLDQPQIQNIASNFQNLRVSRDLVEFVGFFIGERYPSHFCLHAY